MGETSHILFEKTSVPRAFFALTIPNVLNKIVMLLYNMADTFFIARTGNTALVAGVSLVAPVFMVMIAMGDIFGIGGSSLISRLLGQGQYRKAKGISSFCFWGSLGAGAVLGILLLLFQTPILTLLGADSSTMKYAAEYYQYIVWGAPLIVASVVPLNLLRTEGLVKAAVAGSVLGSVINIILDPVFIFWLDMGAAGAAIATVLGNAGSVLLSMWFFLFRSRLLSIRPGMCRLSLGELGQILVIGIPASVTNFMQSVSIALTNRFLLPYGTDKIAAFGIAQKINMIAAMIITGFSFGSQPLLGYNYGAGNYKRLKNIFKFIYTFETEAALVLSLVLGISVPWLVEIFLSDPAVTEAGTQILRVQMAGIVFMAVTMVSVCAFQSSGKAGAAFILAVSRQGIVFAAVLAAASALAGYTGVISTQPVSDMITAGIAGVLFYKNFGKELKDYK